METNLFYEMLIILLLSVISLCICFRLKIPSIIGFFIAGAIAGPHNLCLVKSVHEVEMLAEIGVILLLFTIGIEFSIEHLLQFKKPVLLGGSLQVAFTIIVTFLILNFSGYKTSEALFAGFLISLSSTAIVLKIIQERGELDSPYGKTSFAILIFQDIVIVPMMLFAPLLGGKEMSSDNSILFILLKVIIIIGIVIVGVKWVVPYTLYKVTRTKSKELFILSIVLICFGEAGITYSAGLSLALGAFLAGIVISGSGYGNQTMASILPLKDLFMSFFFISIGMLLNINFILQNIIIIIIITIFVVLLKFFIAGLATLALGYPLRTVILTGLALSQIGEFSFILSKSGIAFGLLNDYNYQIFLSVSVITMALTSFILKLAKPLSNIIYRLPIKIKTGLVSEETGEEPENNNMENHVIIIGFGINGRNLVYACKKTSIPYVIIELNPDTVKKEKLKGEPIFYGDASYEAVLKHFNIEKSRIISIGINDPAATFRITETVRRLNKSIYIIVRTRFMQDLDSLYKLGANEVISEEFETSIEIFARVLKKYFIPDREIENIIANLRKDKYKMLRNPSEINGNIYDLTHIPHIEISSVRLGAIEFITEKSLHEIDLRKKYEITLLAIQRDSEIISNPDGNTILRENDILIVLGSLEKINEFSNIVQNCSDGK